MLVQVLILALWMFRPFSALKPVTLKVINFSGHPVDVLWYDDHTKTTTSQIPFPMLNSTEAIFDTFEYHKFIFRLLDDKNEGNHLEAMLTKKGIDETVYVSFDSVTKSLKLFVPDQYDWIREKVNHLVGEHCASAATELDFTACIRNGIAQDLKEVHDRKNTLRKIQDEVSQRLRNYTCADDSLETTKPDYSYQVKIYDRIYEVNVLLDLPHAKIWFVENFITPEECKVFETHGKPLLLRATVAAEDGTSVVSEHRKAQQASYDLHQFHGEKDPVWNLQQRILSLTNHHANYSLTTPGQEGFTIIQYNPTDEYSPHCDGSCDNSPHVKTGRVATAVLYCKSPDRGGATVFTRSNILVKPKLGSATFFAYKGADGRMDDGYTEHTGCPVKEGEKWITTFWMRDGVTKEENWTLYDPMGVRILESS